MSMPNLDHLRRNVPKGYEPDLNLAVDMGQKAFDDCRETIARNMALCPTGMEGVIVALVAVAALKGWSDKAVAKVGGAGALAKIAEACTTIFASKEADLPDTVEALKRKFNLHG